MIECGNSIMVCAPERGRSGPLDAVTRSEEATSAFDRAWDEVARASDPEPSPSAREDAGADPVVDSCADAERDDADRRAVVPAPPGAATPVTPALDPAVLASIIVNRAQVSTDTAGAMLATAMPGGVPIDDLKRAPSEAAMSGTDGTPPSVASKIIAVPSTQEQPDAVATPVGGGESNVPSGDEAKTSSMPQSEAAEAAHASPSTVRPSASPVSGDASRAVQPSVVALDPEAVATEPSPRIGDGSSTHNGPTGSGERESDAASDVTGLGERNGIRPSDAASIRLAFDGAMVEWSEAAAPTAEGAADQVVATAGAASRLPTDAVMRTVTRGMIEQVHALRTDGARAWSVQLEPDEFGSVRVQILVQDQGVTADILTGHPAVRDLFQQHQGELRQALADAGLRVDRLSVSVGDAGHHSPNRSWDSGRESWTGREPAAGWTAQRVEPSAAVMGWTAWADAGARHAVNVYV